MSVSIFNVSIFHSLSMPAKRIKVIGMVQGVFFRVRAKNLADKLGLKGWIRNCADGSVEIHAEGTGEALKELESWCHRGPPDARVEEVRVESVPERGLTMFEVAR